MSIFSSIKIQPAQQLTRNVSLWNPSPLRRALYRGAILSHQVLLCRNRTLADTGHDHTANTVLQQTGNALIEGNVGLEALNGGRLPAIHLAKDAVEVSNNSLGILLEIVDDGVRAGIEGISGNGPASSRIDGLNGANSGARNVVHVEDGRIGVGAGSVERVGVAHRNLGKGGKVALGNRLLHDLHVLGHHRLDALLEETGGGNSLLHARGRADTLLGGGRDEDKGAHLGPVRGLGNLVGHGIGSISSLTHAPGNITTKQTAAGGTGALASDQAQLRGGGRELVEVGDSPHKGSEASGGRGETGSGREVVLGDDAQGHGGELGERGVGSLESGTTGAKLAEAGLGASARDIGRLAIEKKGVTFGVRGRAGSGSEGAEVGLGESDGERAVGWEVELGVALAPVPGIAGDRAKVSSDALLYVFV